jgi:hypothetical protein
MQENAMNPQSPNNPTKSTIHNKKNNPHHSPIHNLNNNNWDRKNFDDRNGNQLSKIQFESKYSPVP